MSKFANDDIQIPDYRIELWTNTGDFITDISSIAVSNIVLQKERNMTDQLHVSIEYDQLLKRIENVQNIEVLKPFLTELKLKRNFVTIFAGFVSLVQLNLSTNKKRHLEIEAKGYGDYLDKRLVTGTYAEMSYPDMARALLEDSKHELNWFSNYAFEYQDDWFRGWKTIQGSVVQASLKHWNGGIVLQGTNQVGTNTIIETEAVMATPAIGISQQYLCFDMWYRLAEDVHYIPYTREEVEQYEPAGPKKDAMLAWFDRYGSPGELVTTRLILTFTDENGNETEITHPVSFLSKYNVWMHLKNTLGYEEFYKNIPLGSTKGNCTKVRFEGDGHRLAISDLALYRDLDPSIDVGDEANIEETTMYRDRFIEMGEWDSALDSYSNDRVRHFHRQNVKKAIQNLAKLEDQNFEFRVDENKKMNFYKYEGNTSADILLNYPGVIDNISIKRSIDQVYNVNYGVSEDVSQAGDAQIWCAGASSRPAISYYKFPMVTSNDYENIDVFQDIYGAALSGIQNYDEVQNVPTITLNSNVYNPSNVHIGDAVTLQIDGGDLFDFINGTYRVYAYTLRVSTDSVEEIEITLIEPTAIELHEITFPKYLKLMSNDIKRLWFNQAS